MRYFCKKLTFEWSLRQLQFGKKIGEKLPEIERAQQPWSQAVKGPWGAIHCNAMILISASCLTTETIITIINTVTTTTIITITSFDFYAMALAARYMPRGRRRLRGVRIKPPGILAIENHQNHVVIKNHHYLAFKDKSNHWMMPMPHIQAFRLTMISILSASSEALRYSCQYIQGRQGTLHIFLSLGPTRTIYTVWFSSHWKEQN